MGWTYGFLLSVMILRFASISLGASSTRQDFLHCESTVRRWAETSVDSGIKEDKLSLKDLLYFLHVPRTGGRTYFYCFLRKLYASYQECPRSYDKLRFDPSKPNCKLVVTHDDYSLMSKLPKERTSVVTVLRNPFDRVLSTYEFSVEVAARFLVHPNLTSVTQMSGRIRTKARGVSTLDIWPWKYLVPWMREDLFARRDARSGGARVNEDNGNPYNMPRMVMPLHDYINDPLAHDIIHNGATFQVAGLTNNSYVAESHTVRGCVRRYPELGHFILDIAKARLNRMLYVGLTEEHKKSAIMFANMVGSQVLSQSGSNSPSDLEGGGSNETLHIANDQEGGVPSLSSNVTKNDNMTVAKLMEAYESCVSSLRKSQFSRRAISLKRIAPANFTKEARLHVPDSLRQQILSLNSLDLELYKHARSIYIEQEKHLRQNNQDIAAQQKLILTKMEGLDISNCYCCRSWKLLWLGMSMLVAVALVIVTGRRRTSKIKV